MGAPRALPRTRPGPEPGDPVTPVCCSGREGGHLQGNTLPQLLGLLAPLQVLQHVVELHHAHGRQAESTPSAADDVDKVIVVSRRQMDEPVVDVLQRKNRSARAHPVYVSLEFLLF